MENEKVINRFEAGIEAKLINALNKIFSETNNCSESDAVEIENCSCADCTHVFMVTAKTEQAKRVLSRFVDKNSMPKIPFSLVESKKKDFKDHLCWFDSPLCQSKHSIQYIRQIIDVLKVFEKGYDSEDFIQTTIGNDSPICIENEHFSFLLAPRIESE